MKNEITNLKEAIKADINKEPRSHWLAVGAIWVLILSTFFSGIGVKAQGIEDYTTSIDQLHFGSVLKAEIYDTQVVYARAKAVACQEGFYKEGTIAQTQNNPGNLKKSGYSVRKGHSLFETELQGWMELRALLYRYNHLSLEAIGSFYAEDDNWANGVRRCLQTV